MRPITDAIYGPLILQFIRAAASDQAPGAMMTATEEVLTRIRHFYNLVEDSASTPGLA